MTDRDRYIPGVPCWADAAYADPAAAAAFDAGRMATFTDPEGAAISVWQPARHRGSLVVNEHGGVNFNDL